MADFAYNNAKNASTGYTPFDLTAAITFVFFLKKTMIFTSN